MMECVRGEDGQDSPDLSVIHSWCSSKTYLDLGVKNGGRVGFARSRPATAADQLATHSIAEKLKPDIRGKRFGAVGGRKRMRLIQFRAR